MPVPAPLRRPKPQPCRFTGTLDGASIVIRAVPPDETDPQPDYEWCAWVEDHAELPAGGGFTEHQAVHNLIERIATAGRSLTGVLKAHE